MKHCKLIGCAGISTIFKSLLDGHFDQRWPMKLLPVKSLSLN